MTLHEFLNANSGAYNLTTDVAISKRLSDENGKPFLFKIKGFLASEYDSLRKRHTVIKKAGEFEFNNMKFSIDLILQATVYPDFKDSKNIKAAGFLEADDYIQAVLLPGEIDKLATEILKFNGFNQEDDLIEEAKN